MSEILNRMLSRARAPLSSVEPLYSPRYAESHHGAQALPGERAGLEEMSTETTGANPRAGGEPTTAHEVHSTATKDAQNTIDEGNRTSSPILRVVYEESRGLSTAPKVRDFEVEEVPDIKRSENPVVPSEVRDVPRAKASLTEPNPAGPERSLSQTVITGMTAKTPELPRVQTSLLQKQEPAFSRSRGGNLAAGKENQEPSVTISIGHIEIRPAQTVERPRKAPFRPKVSLADFLSRKQGGTRE